MQLLKDPQAARHEDPDPRIFHPWEVPTQGGR